MDKKINCCMKASPFYLKQIEDKVERLEKLREEGIDLNKKAQIELHIIDLLNPLFWKKSVENCNNFSDRAEYIMHAQCLMDPRTGVEFSKEIGSKKVVIHRLYDIVTKSRKKATEKNNEEMISIADENQDMKFCMENVSVFRLIAPEHAYIRYLMKEEYLVNPLNHFFPWEMKEFIEATKDVKNLGICFDSAHAAITCNIFNYLKKEGKKENRFSDVIDEDLEQAEHLEVIDFLRASKEKLLHCHFNDAFLYKGMDFSDKYIVEEGLQIGDGDIDFRGLVKEINDDDINWLVELSAVKDYDNAIEMEEACRRLFKLYNS